MTFNAMAAIVDALKTHPEPVSLPEALIDATPVQLAEARSRLQQISQVANELRKTVDVLLASHLAGGALRYGETVMMPAYRGAPKIVDEAEWWPKVVEGLKASSRPETLLSALYPASSVRLTALPKLAAALDEDADVLRKEHIRHDAPTAIISVMPLDRAPKWAQQLNEGQFSGEKNNG